RNCLDSCRSLAGAGAREPLRSRRGGNETRRFDVNVGVIGSGEVGEALANGFLKHGHRVCRGSRDPAKLAEWKQKAGGAASTGTPAEAAQFGELLVLAVKGDGAEEAVRL